MKMGPPGSQNFTVASSRSLRGYPQHDTIIFDYYIKYPVQDSYRLIYIAGEVRIEYRSVLSRCNSVAMIEKQWSVSSLSLEYKVSVAKRPDLVPRGGGAHSRDVPSVTYVATYVSREIRKADSIRHSAWIQYRQAVIASHLFRIRN